MQRKVRVANLTEALTFFTAKLGGKVVRTEYGASGPVAFVLVAQNGTKAYLFFKRDWLHSYGFLFPDETWKGWGQTLNYNLLKKAAAEDAWIMIVTPDSEELPVIYSSAAKEWLGYSEAHKTIRQPAGEVGLEASVPANMVRRVEVRK